MIIEGQLGRFFGCAPLACLFGWLVVFLLVWLGLVWADWFVLAFACLLCVVWVSFVCFLFWLACLIVLFRLAWLFCFVVMLV